MYVSQCTDKYTHFGNPYSQFLYTKGIQVFAGKNERVPFLEWELLWSEIIVTNRYLYLQVYP